MKWVQDKLYRNRTELVGHELGFLMTEFPSLSDIEIYATRGHIDFLLTFSNDGNNQTIPEGTLSFTNIHAEHHTRNWLVWSQHKESVHCSPCWICSNCVCCSMITVSITAIDVAEGEPASTNWWKLHNRMHGHEKNNGHRKCYLARRQWKWRLSLQEGVVDLLETSKKWNLKNSTTFWDELMMLSYSKENAALLSRLLSDAFLTQIIEMS